MSLSSSEKESVMKKHLGNKSLVKNKKYPMKQTEGSVSIIINNKTSYYDAEKPSFNPDQFKNNGNGNFKSK